MKGLFLTYDPNIQPIPGTFRFLVTCRYCQKRVEKYGSQIRGTVRKNGFFCSTVCLANFRSEFLVRELGANYRGGIKKDRKYQLVMAFWHPNKNKKGYVALHRIIAEAKIGRYLQRHEIVHHIDHNAENNHWDNIEVVTRSEHAKIHRAQNEVAKWNKKLLRQKTAST